MDLCTRGGCGVDGLLAELIASQTIGRTPPPDLMLLDFNQNNAGWGDIEKFIRVAHIFLPSTLLLIIWTGYRTDTPIRSSTDNLGHDSKVFTLSVARHYELPLLCYTDAEDEYARQGGDYDTMWKSVDLARRDRAHPAASAHVYLSDILVHLMNVEIRKLRTCSFGEASALPDGPLRRKTYNATLEAQWKRPLNPDEKGDPKKVPRHMLQTFNIESVNACIEPLSMHSAYEPSPSSPQLSQDDSWRLYEDRPRKPGWITEGAGTGWITFPVIFGKTPKLIVSYLRSYEGLGAVEAVLHAKGKPNVSLGTIHGTVVGEADRVSETETLAFQGSYWMYHNGSWLPSTSANVSFRLQKGKKFKVTGVVAC
eukprot:TRINITY_DN33829_c0_g1_i2.p1 TRINITY_DN33829_c0_g1~~TRINITY_DN33829_c0_g1_i2.p1  ORF type:complete len:367 (+),score=36.99 TRINITY_DN33829_c0_g1_i2:79-1179(+)